MMIIIYIIRTLNYKSGLKFSWELLNSANRLTAHDILFSVYLMEAPGSIRLEASICIGDPDHKSMPRPTVHTFLQIILNGKVIQEGHKLIEVFFSGRVEAII